MDNQDSAWGYLLYSLHQLEATETSFKKKLETIQLEIELARKTFSLPSERSWTEQMLQALKRYSERLTFEQLFKFTPKYGK